MPPPSPGEGVATNVRVFRFADGLPPRRATCVDGGAPDLNAADEAGIFPGYRELSARIQSAFKTSGLRFPSYCSEICTSCVSEGVDFGPVSHWFFPKRRDCFLVLIIISD